MSSAGPVHVRFFAAPADLAPFFSTIYRIDVDLPDGEVITDYLQPSWTNLRFHTGNPARMLAPTSPTDGTARFSVAGPSASLAKYELGRASIWGFGLFPQGWARFIGRVASEYADDRFDGERTEGFSHLSPLCDILCGDGEDVEDQFERAMRFFRECNDTSRDSDRIRAAQEAMLDPHLLHVEDFAARVGVSKRTLERLCNRHFGFPPRLLLRRQRIIRVLTAFMLERGSWNAVIDSNYHDHPHFVHEFKTFIGMSPSEYAAMPHPMQAAFVADRRRVWGSPAQAPHRPK